MWKERRWLPQTWVHLPVIGVWVLIRLLAGQAYAQPGGAAAKKARPQMQPDTGLKAPLARTDVYEDEKPGPNPCKARTRTFQVKVSEGREGHFSWTLTVCSDVLYQGGMLLADEGYAHTCQPDVAVGPFKNQIWATVVGISAGGAPGFGRILVQHYRWNETEHEFIREDRPGLSTHYLGLTWRTRLTLPSVVGQSLGRVCQSPRIDANPQGETAVVWAETEKVVRTENDTSPGQPAYYTRGNVYSAQGNLDGSGGFNGGIGGVCDRQHSYRLFRLSSEDRGYLSTEMLYSYGVLLYDEGNPGDAIGLPEKETTPDQEYTWFTHPQVCISPHNEDWGETRVSYVFYQWAAPPPSVTPVPGQAVVTGQRFGSCYFSHALWEREGLVYPDDTRPGRPYRRTTQPVKQGQPMPDCRTGFSW